MSWEREMTDVTEAVASRCPALLPADVVLTRSNTLLGKTIRFAERRPGDPAVYNHVGIVTQSGIVAPGAVESPLTPRAEMTEALWRVRRGLVWDFYGPPAGDKRPEVAVYRPYVLDSSTRSRIAARAEEFVGEKYGYWKLGAHLADSALSAVVPFVKDVRLFRRLLFWDGRPICSFLVAEAFASQGLDFGVPSGTASPDDIEDFCRSHDDRYRLIFEGVIS